MERKQEPKKKKSLTTFVDFRSYMGGLDVDGECGISETPIRTQHDLGC